MEIDEYLNKCRCCLKEISEKDKANEINEEVQQQFYDLTQIYLDFSLSYLSKVICKKCKLNLQEWTILKKELIDNQNKLTEIFQQGIKFQEIGIKVEPLDFTFEDDSFDDREEIPPIKEEEEIPPIKKEKEIEKFPCKFCKLKFKEIKLLENHQLNKHRKLLTKNERRNIRRRKIEDRSLVCPICGIQTHYLKNHMERKHLNVKRFFCDLCGYKAFHKSEIDLHMFKHKDPMFICDFCDGKFARKMALKRHMLRIHLNVNYVKEYKKRENPRKNIGLIGPDSKKVKCNHCNKEILRSSYKLHIEQVHTVSKNGEICKVCHKKFKNKRALSYHVRTHKEKIYKCDYANCDKAFCVESHLIHHKTVHENLREFKCSYDGCKKSYFIKRHLNMHISLHHEKYTVKCLVPDCKFSVGRKDYMRNHISKQHKDLPNDLINYYMKQIKELQLW